MSPRARRSSRPPRGMASATAARFTNPAMSRPATRLVRRPWTGSRWRESPERTVATPNAGHSHAPRNRQRRRRHDTRASVERRRHFGNAVRSSTVPHQERRSGDPVPGVERHRAETLRGATSEGEEEVATATTRPARSAGDRLADADRVALLRYMLLMRAVEERAM